jgi:hypothetical protein
MVMEIIVAKLVTIFFDVLTMTGTYRIVLGKHSYVVADRFYEKQVNVLLPSFLSQS